jgi:2-phosphosulfolactate phosphatase
LPRLHVLTNKMYADPARLADVVAIVVDIVFATTGIAVLLERGATDVLPTLAPDAARAAAAELAPGSFVLAGEKDGDPIPGFAEPWPLQLLDADLAGKRVVYSTTNGTVALNMAASAGLVLAGALVNGSAVADYACEHLANRDVVLICAGSGTSFSLEDFYGAGYIASLLAASGRGFKLSDAAHAARLLSERAPADECIVNTYTGRMMTARGRRADLEFCGRRDVLAAAPVFRDGRITRG